MTMLLISMLVTEKHLPLNDKKIYVHVIFLQDIKKTAAGYKVLDALPSVNNFFLQF